MLDKPGRLILRVTILFVIFKVYNKIIYIKISHKLTYPNNAGAKTPWEWSKGAALATKGAGTKGPTGAGKTALCTMAGGPGSTPAA